MFSATISSLIGRQTRVDALTESFIIIVPYVLKIEITSGILVLVGLMSYSPLQIFVVQIFERIEITFFFVFLIILSISLACKFVKLLQNIYFVA